MGKERSNLERDEKGHFKTGDRDALLESWLSDNFASSNTRITYTSALKHFKKTLGTTDLKTYLNGLTAEQAQNDFKRFVSGLNGRPSMTVATYVTALRAFYSDHDIEINGLKKMRRRGFLPKRVKAQTQDRPPTVEELKKILNYMSLGGRALTLFLASSGCRVGESIQILREDLNLTADPPRAFIRGENTKAGMGERTVFMSYEARDAIKDWLNVKDSMKNKRGFTLGTQYVFPFRYLTYLRMFSEATRKAGLAIEDQRTKRGIIHPHALRKFFRNRIKMERDFTEALMGHLEGMDEAYRRVDLEELAAAYKQNMANVSVFVDEDLMDMKVFEKLSSLESENEQLRGQIGELRGRLNGITESRRESDQVMNRLFEDPEFRELVKKKLKQLT
jgi:integrase